MGLVVLEQAPFVGTGVPTLGPHQGVREPPSESLGQLVLRHQLESVRPPLATVVVARGRDIVVERGLGGAKHVPDVLVESGCVEKDVLPGSVFHARRVLDGELILERGIAEHLVGLIAGGGLVEEASAALEGQLAGGVVAGGQARCNVEFRGLRKVVAANAGKHQPVRQGPKLELGEKSADVHVFPGNFFVEGRPRKGVRLTLSLLGRIGNIENPTPAPDTAVAAASPPSKCRQAHCRYVAGPRLLL